MNILFAAAEGSPFIKTGGLADVIGSLPKALVKKGNKVSVIMPKYKNIRLHDKTALKTIYTGEVYVGWRRQYVGVEHLQHDGVDFYFIDNQDYFYRDACYGEFDDGERFSYFCRAVLEVLPHLPSGMPQVIHCHDWHTGPIAAMYKTQYEGRSGYENIKVVYTIHNLKYQGVFPLVVGTDMLGFDSSVLNPYGAEYYGAVNFMKAGIAYADKITTVSETYAREIQEPYYGEDLDGLLWIRRDDLVGIVNGIDYEMWDPENDDSISLPFNFRSPKRKRKMKEELQADLGLEVNKDIPMISMVTRIVDQKGFDLVGRVLTEISALPVQLVVLGVGDEEYVGMLRYFEYVHPSKISLELFFDEHLAHRIYAASDMFLIPSKFEPCGIGQLIAMRYGSIPIARHTGGLADTIEMADVEEGTGTGFFFYNYNAHEMLTTIEKAVDLYQNNEKVWNRLIRNAMQADYSWSESAGIYNDLYEALVEG